MPCDQNYSGVTLINIRQTNFTASFDSVGGRGGRCKHLHCRHNSKQERATRSSTFARMNILQVVILLGSALHCVAINCSAHTHTK